jgi:hypothetical protein
VLLFRTQPNALCRYNPYGACGRALLEHHLHVMLHVWTCHGRAARAPAQRSDRTQSAHAGRRGDAALAGPPTESHCAPRCAQSAHHCAF